jgi:hypothetical protein
MPAGLYVCLLAVPCHVSAHCASYATPASPDMVNSCPSCHGQLCQMHACGIRCLYSCVGSAPGQPCLCCLTACFLCTRPASRRHGTPTSRAAVHEVPMQLACTCGVKRCQHQPELGAGAQCGEQMRRLQQQDRCPAMHACRLRPKLCWPQAMMQDQQHLQCTMWSGRQQLC